MACGNISKYDIPKLLDDPDNIRDNLQHYLAGFSPETREILDRFEFASQITRLHKSGLLYLVLGKLAEIDLHPDKVTNLEMGYLYEELIRKFSELSNETAGEHFTPREVIKLMVNLLFIEDDAVLSKPGAKATLYDAACGTGGMLSVAEDFVRTHNPQATLHMFGQELNVETYAICRSDMMLKGQNASNIKLGNSLKRYDPEDPGDQGDQHPTEKFDYLLANPPFGVEEKGGRLGAARASVARLRRPLRGRPATHQRRQLPVPPAHDLQDAPSRPGWLTPGHRLQRLTAVHRRSRQWRERDSPLDHRERLARGRGRPTRSAVLQHRNLHLLLDRHQPQDRQPQGQGAAHRRPRQLRQDAQSLGEKRKEISDTQLADIVRLYGNFDQQLSDEDAARVKIFPNERFGFLRITVERPLRLKWEVTDESADALAADKRLAKLSSDDVAALVECVRGRVGTEFTSDAEARAAAKKWMGAVGEAGKPVEAALVDAMTVRDPHAAVVTDARGRVEPDTEMRDNENVPLPSDPVRYEPDPTERLAIKSYRSAVEQYVKDEVHPYVPDAWVDHTKTKIGYEVPLTRHFYVYTPPRPLAEIDAEIKTLEREIQELLREVTE